MTDWKKNYLPIHGDLMIGELTMSEEKTDYKVNVDEVTVKEGQYNHIVYSIKPKVTYPLRLPLNNSLNAWIDEDNLPFQLKILDERITMDMLKPERPMSAAFDLRACISEPLAIPPQKSILIPTGVAIFINDSCIAGCIVPRSGTGHKRGLVLGNGLGLIDGDYQGEWMVSALNRNEDKYVEIEPMERIAQAFFVPVFHPSLKLVKKFSTETERGEGGFGSTGK